MGKIFKWIGYLIGALVLLIISLYVISQYQLNRRFDVQPPQITVPHDENTINHGRHLAVTRGCIDCHGENLAGSINAESLFLGRISATNLTGGSGGVGQHYSDTDWVRAIRHGIGQDGKALFFMPSNEYYYLSDRDLTSLIAYIKSQPSLDNDIGETWFGPLLRLLFLLGELPLAAAEVIDHQGARPEPPIVDVTAEYGRYLSVGCALCHGEDFAGGSIPGDPPGWPEAPNLTPAGNLSSWNEADFIMAMRTGVTPSGHKLNPEYMIWPSYAHMTDDELKAMWLFFRSLEAQTIR